MQVDWALIFDLTNLIAVVGWLALALMPRREPVLAAVLWGGAALLCLAYAAMFVGLMGGVVDPARDGAGSPPPFEYTLDGLQTAFAAKGVLVMAWTHYLAFDLFVGLWIARDADQRRVGRLMQLPFFLATFLAGPIGLLAWLLMRGRLGRR